MLKPILLALFVLISLHNANAADSNADSKAKTEQELKEVQNKIEAAEKELNETSAELKNLTDKLEDVEKLEEEMEKLEADITNQLEQQEKLINENQQEIDELSRKIEEHFDKIKTAANPTTPTSKDASQSYAEKKSEEAADEIIRKFKDLLDRPPDARMIKK